MPSADLETDLVLLRASRRGDESAARALYARLAPALVLQARGVLRDHQLAEDAVQNAMCKIFRASPRAINAINCPRAWLAQTVRREALTMLRTHRRLVRRQRERAAIDARVSLSSSGSSRGVGDLEQLSRAVDCLSRRDAELILLKHVSALTFDQIALVLSINRNTVVSRYRAARTALEAVLARSPSTRSAEVRHER